MGKIYELEVNEICNGSHRIGYFSSIKKAKAYVAQFAPNAYWDAHYSADSILDYLCDFEHPKWGHVHTISIIPVELDVTDDTPEKWHDTSTEVKLTDIVTIEPGYDGTDNFRFSASHELITGETTKITKEVSKSDIPKIYKELITEGYITSDNVDNERIYFKRQTVHEVGVDAKFEYDDAKYAFEQKEKEEYESQGGTPYTLPFSRIKWSVINYASPNYPPWMGLSDEEHERMGDEIKRLFALKNEQPPT